MFNGTGFMDWIGSVGAIFEWVVLCEWWLWLKGDGVWRRVGRDETRRRRSGS